MAEPAMTGLNTHRAIANGYALNRETGFSTSCRPGDVVPPNCPVSYTWMVEAAEYRGPPARDPRSGGGLTLESHGQAPRRPRIRGGFTHHLKPTPTKE